MIKEFEKVRYKWEEQKEKYLEIAPDLSLEKKQELLEILLETDLWSYFRLITEILFNIASDNEDYIKLLEKVYLKVRNDMGSALFFDMLIDLGQNKKDIGIKIYNKIQGESNNEGLKDVSGLILGGYSINDNAILNKLIEDKKLSYPLTSTLIKAVMVKSERMFDRDNNYDLSGEEYEFLDFVSQSDDERFLKELMNLYRFLYHIDEIHFYKKIKNLMNKKKSSINGMIWIFKEKLKLSNEQLLELAEFTKDCDEYAISELISAITHNKLDYSSKEIKEISELFIYWINKDLEFKIRFFDYSLEELSKNNIEFLDYFLENYKKIIIDGKSLDYNFLFPGIFKRLIKYRMKESIPKLLEGNVVIKNPKLFYNLSEKVIGEIYKLDDKKEGFDLFLPLAKKIQEIAKKEDFVNHRDKKLEDYTFDDLIDYIKDLLSQLIFRKRDFDFKEIHNNLSKIEKFNNSIEIKLKKIEKDKKYSPMFWLGSQKRDKELKEAYLQEIETFIMKSNTIENEKSGNNIREFEQGLSSESKFWNTFSEIIFTNKFLQNKEEFNPVLEPKIPNKDSNADLAIKLNNKKMFFEVTNPEMNRSVHLDNGAVFIKNKLNKVLQEKAKQYWDEKTFQEIKKGDRDDLFFIVVDGSNSSIDEYMVQDSFYGSLEIKIPKDPSLEPKTIRKDDAVIKNKEFVSGLVYFKSQLINTDGKIKVILMGDIIENPDAINKITPEDYKKLKRIIFGK